MRVLRAVDTRILTLFAAVVGASQSAALRAENPIAEAAERGGNPVYVIRETTGAAKKGNRLRQDAARLPDLLTLKDGRMVEAWDLRVIGDRLKFVVRKGGRESARNLLRREVASVEMQRTIADVRREEEARNERPPAVRSRHRQPVRQREILAGHFAAQQGRFTDWVCTFTSQINKYYDHAANATEYGTFVLRNRMHQPGIHKSEVRAKGKYFLYAPGVFGNKTWVLNLSEVSYTERNIWPRRSVYTERLTDEVFVLKMSRDHKVFHLEWANQPGWNWTSPTQQTFYRVLSDAEREAAQARLNALNLRFPSEDSGERLPHLALRD